MFFAADKRKEVRWREPCRAASLVAVRGVLPGGTRARVLLKRAQLSLSLPLRPTAAPHPARLQLKEKQPTLSLGEVGKATGEAWGKLSDKEVGGLALAPPLTRPTARLFEFASRVLRPARGCMAAAAPLLMLLLLRLCCRALRTPAYW